MSEDRLEQIEVSLAYQENLVSELNKVVYQQQKQIDKLENTLQRCIATIREMPESIEPRNLQDEKPPHYQQ